MTLQTVSVDANGFRAALGNFASSVNVITMTDDDGRPLGMTATAFSSVSIDPLLILVCINRSTRTYQHIAARRVFGVNILGAVARDISDYCARAGADKNLDPRWLVQHSQWRAPALGGALAFLDCEVEQDIPAGTHAVLIGAVRGIGLNPAASAHEPLVYFQGEYRPLLNRMRYPKPDDLPVLLADHFS
ncbi:flavin reductase family protein [Thermocrispum agreste]|uniref:Flavin reductase family protein n=1 Tax=Thermocrispum agreste TaxID=37925 RepID=A0ABD6FAZ7_9PSEU|nr:flavin reductase family protein [Thermocrispum agreste]